MAQLALREKPVVITVAPTGAEVTRDDNPAVPYVPREIAAEVIEASKASATVAHLHVREPDGTPSARSELFTEAVHLIRGGCDIAIGVSTGGSIGMSVSERIAGLTADPDLCSIETGSINFGDDLFATLPHETTEIAKRAGQAGVELIVEAFELGHIDAALGFLDSGSIPEPLRIDLVLGIPGAVSATVSNLLAMAGAVPDGVRWGATVVGRHQRRLLALALLLGADFVRVGFEDNVYLRRGHLADSNAELVRDIAALCRELGRPVASIEQARELLALG